MSASKTPAPKLHAGPTLRPLAEPLRLAAIELADLARLSDQLQRAIGRLTERHGAPDPDFLTEAQAADLLSQRLEGMAAFLRVIAASAPETVTTDVYAAVMNLTLAEQARRLSGLPPATELPFAEPLQSCGELQLLGD
ncbi:MAG: hypothetical protein ACXWKM_03995 [Phenylobacterium sp.]